MKDVLSIYSSSGWCSIKNIGSLVKIYYVFRENYKSLIFSITQLEQSCSPLRCYLDNVTWERDLFNCLASAISLCDIITVVSKHEANVEFAKNILKWRNDEWFKNNLWDFVKKLRNIQIHQACLQPMLSESYRLVYLLDDLHDYKDWNSGSKAFINSLSSDLPISTLMTQYFSIVQSLIQKILDEYLNVHYNDLVETRKQMDEQTPDDLKRIYDALIVTKKIRLD